MVKVPDWTTRRAPLATPRRRDDVVVRELGGEVVFTDPRSGCSYLLNRTAWLVWQGCDGMTTSRSIAKSMTETFDIDEDTALNDVEEVIGWFAAQGLCEETRKP